jgi:hypothetical protein
MARLQHLLNLSVDEAMSLSDHEANFLAQKIQFEAEREALATGGSTGGDLVSVVRARVAPALGQIRAARAAAGSQIVSGGPPKT